MTAPFSIDPADFLHEHLTQASPDLMITGTSSLDRIADAIAQGAASWIVKGATFDELVHAAVEIMQARDTQL